MNGLIDGTFWLSGIEEDGIFKGISPIFKGWICSWKFGKAGKDETKDN